MRPTLATRVALSLAAALTMTVSTAAAGQIVRCTKRQKDAQSLVYGSFGSATGAHRRLNSALGTDGFAPLAENAVAGGIGFWMRPRGGCTLIQAEANLLSWETRGARDGRTIAFSAVDLMGYGGGPVLHSGRTYVYPLLGLGMRIHFLDVMGADTARVLIAPPSTPFQGALRRSGEWDGPVQLIGDLGVGAHYLAGALDGRFALVIGARMGYVVGAAHNQWIVGADTIRGPMVNTSGPYGRLLIGIGYRRRESPPRPQPPREWPEGRVRGGRPTRRIG